MPTPRVPSLRDGNRIRFKMFEAMFKAVRLVKPMERRHTIASHKRIGGIHARRIKGVNVSIVVK